MGADIHAFVESVDSSRVNTWVDSVAELTLPRDYYMFGLLAGVRGIEGPVFPNRGIPKVTGWTVRNRFHLYVLTDDEAAEGHLREMGTVTPEEAADYLAYSSQYMPGNERYITHPDWHSASYLNAREYEQVLAEYKRTFGCRPGRLYEAVADFLFAIPDSRIVFWFDS